MSLRRAQWAAEKQAGDVSIKPVQAQATPIAVQTVLSGADVELLTKSKDDTEEKKDEQPVIEPTEESKVPSENELGDSDQKDISDETAQSDTEQVQDSEATESQADDEGDVEKKAETDQ